MDFPERFSNLPEYAFPRLRRLLDGVPPGGPERAMSIGEPKHPFPDWIGEIIATNLDGFGNYPPNDGTPELLAAISAWIARRYGVTVPENRLMALNGTREGLFNTILALCPETKGGGKPVVLVPNPFYQVYAVAALTVGAEPVYVPATAQTGFLPDFASLPAEILDRTVAAFICSPSNPQGAVASRDYLSDLLDLAERHDFRIHADECYSEIYRGTPPPGILQVAADCGADPERVLAFHSLSKRSSLPGLRSGFVAAGPEAMRQIRQLRAYAGAPLPLPLQKVAEITAFCRSSCRPGFTLKGSSRCRREPSSPLPRSILSSCAWSPCRGLVWSCRTKFFIASWSRALLPRGARLCVTVCSVQAGRRNRSIRLLPRLRSIRDAAEKP